MRTYRIKAAHIGRTDKRGFTLVEAMVAISILSLAITGPMLIAQKGIGSAIYARDQITAFYLAQEAVEYIRNVRDTNRIAGSSWLNGLTACVDTGSAETCTVDARKTDFTSPGAIGSCPGGVCPKISFDPVTNLYGYGIGSPTQFTRTVSIDTRGDTANVPAKEGVISVTISWNTALFSPPRTFTVKEYIFNF